ncbi:MAG: hypothetical protein CMI02_10385 [Oceanospirillaceae bacterium]|nr:hypothetical protein [Oceanospirillaceae bacterium]
MSVVRIARGGAASRDRDPDDVIRDSRLIMRMVNEGRQDEEEEEEEDTDEEEDDEDEFVGLEEEHELLSDTGQKQRNQRPKPKTVPSIRDRDQVRTLLDTAQDPKRRNRSSAQKKLKNGAYTLKNYTLLIEQYFRGPNVDPAVCKAFEDERQKLRKEMERESLMEEDSDESNSRIMPARFTDEVDDDDPDGLLESTDDEDDDDDEQPRRRKKRRRGNLDSETTTTSSSGSSDDDDDG